MQANNAVQDDRPLRGRRALSTADELVITARVCRGESQAALAREYGVHRNTVRAIVARRNKNAPGVQTEGNQHDGNTEASAGDSASLPSPTHATQE